MIDLKSFSFNTEFGIDNKDDPTTPPNGAAPPKLEPLKAAQRSPAAAPTLPEAAAPPKTDPPQRPSEGVETRAPLNLPPALAFLLETPHWVIWKWETLPTGKPTKVPYQGIQPRFRAATNNPETWCAYGLARGALDAGFGDGVGFCLQGTDILAFDIDDCRDKETGAIAPWARALVERAGSYCEVTPSGTGLRIIGHGSGPPQHRKLTVGGGVSCECYRKATRYITVSGQQFGTANALANLDALMDEVVRELDKAKPGTPEDGGHHAAQGSDAGVDVEALPITSWAKDLATGDPGRRKYPSKSEAVFALIGAMLKGAVPDEVQVAVLLDPAFIEGEHLRKAGNAAATAQRQIERYRARFPIEVETPRRDAKPELRWHGEAQATPTQWLVKGVLPQIGAGLLSGQWGTFKTFVALDLAGSVMTGRPWLTRRIKRTGGVLFIAAEAEGDVPHRLDSLVDHKLRAERQADWIKGDRTALPFTWVGSGIPLCEKGALEQLTALAHEAAATMAERFGVDLALIVVDTVAAAAGFTNENDAAEGQRVMTVLHALSRATGAVVLGLDHYRKDGAKGTRGSSAKEASADFVVALLGDRDPDTGVVSDTRLAVRKLRVGSTGLEVPFAARVVTLGLDDDGDPITSCIVEWGQPGSRKSAGSKKTKKLSQAASDLQQAVDTLGGLPRARDEVREAFYDLRPAEQKNNAKRQAFDRAMKELGVQGDEILSWIESTI